jgi:outer membrane protein OmpA-like peptidoglycan-associated protein
MLMGKSSFSRCRGKNRTWQLAVLAAVLALAACNPIETWRDWTGASRNDPDPKTTPNSQNLAAGEAADYPNLATVPAPPARAMTAADREKLTQSLIADRANARYSDELLRAGSSVAAPPPPPASTDGSATAEPAAPPAPAPVAVARPAAPLSAARPPPAATAPAAAAASGQKTAAPSSAATPRTAEAGGKAPAAARRLRKQGEPPEPGPMESSLEVPQARATPEPEQIEPPPPPPQLPPAPTVASAPKRFQGGLAAGGALAPVAMPDAKAAAGFEPAPAPPQLPPPAPDRAAAATPGKGAAKPPAFVGNSVAEVKFAADSTSVSDAGRRTLETVVPLYQQNPGKVRVVGYAEGGGGAVEKLNRYRTALDRAQAVAAVLTQAGIPSDKIQVEAAPAGSGSGESRAEVVFEH